MTNGLLIVLLIFIKTPLTPTWIKVTKSFNAFSANYEKVIVLWDFNVEVTGNHRKSFCENHGLKNRIKQSSSYKNPSNPTCIVFIIYSCISKWWP